MGRNEAWCHWRPISFERLGDRFARVCKVGMRIRRPVSRVLCPSSAEAKEGGDHSSRPHIAVRLTRPTRTAQAGDSPTLAQAEARRPYLVLLQAGLAMPLLSPGTRCALTAPFHPCPPSLRRDPAGGLLSVALSLGSRPAGVTRRLVAVEPGLSSSPLGHDLGGPRPPGRLIRGEHGPGAAQGQPSRKLAWRMEPWPNARVRLSGRIVGRALWGADVRLESGRPGTPQRS